MVKFTHPNLDPNRAFAACVIDPDLEQKFLTFIPEKNWLTKFCSFLESNNPNILWGEETPSYTKINDLVSWHLNSDRPDINADEDAASRYLQKNLPLLWGVIQGEIKSVSIDYNPSHNALIASKLLEGIIFCTDGVAERVEYLLTRMTFQKNVTFVLESMRREIIEKAACQDIPNHNIPEGNHVHAVTHYSVIAHALGLGIPTKAIVNLPILNYHKEVIFSAILQNYTPTYIIQYIEQYLFGLVLPYRPNDEEPYTLITANQVQNLLNLFFEKSNEEADAGYSLVNYFNVDVVIKSLNWNFIRKVIIETLYQKGILIQSTLLTTQKPYLAVQLCENHILINTTDYKELLYYYTHLMALSNNLQLLSYYRQLPIIPEVKKSFMSAIAANKSLPFSEVLECLRCFIHTFNFNLDDYICVLNILSLLPKTYQIQVLLQHTTKKEPLFVYLLESALSNNKPEKFFDILATHTNEQLIAFLNITTNKSRINRNYSSMHLFSNSHPLKESCLDYLFRVQKYTFIFKLASCLSTPLEFASSSLKKYLSISHLQHAFIDVNLPISELHSLLEIYKLFGGDQIKQFITNNIAKSNPRGLQKILQLIPYLSIEFCLKEEIYQHILQKIKAFKCIDKIPPRVFNSVVEHVLQSSDKRSVGLAVDYLLLMIKEINACPENSKEQKSLKDIFGLIYRQSEDIQTAILKSLLENKYVFRLLHLKNIIVVHDFIELIKPFPELIKPFLLYINDYNKNILMSVVSQWPEVFFSIFLLLDILPITVQTQTLKILMSTCSIINKDTLISLILKSSSTLTESLFVYTLNKMSCMSKYDQLQILSYPLQQGTLTGTEPLYSRLQAQIILLGNPSPALRNSHWTQPFSPGLPSASVENKFNTNL